MLPCTHGAKADPPQLLISLTTRRPVSRAREKVNSPPHVANQPKGDAVERTRATALSPGSGILRKHGSQDASDSRGFALEQAQAERLGR
jgi:hypothetical protein